MYLGGVVLGLEGAMLLFQWATTSFRFFEGRYAGILRGVYSGAR
jgi:hypothetical protein